MGAWRKEPGPQRRKSSSTTNDVFNGGLRRRKFNLVCLVLASPGEFSCHIKWTIITNDEHAHGDEINPTVVAYHIAQQVSLFRFENSYCRRVV